MVNVNASYSSVIMITDICINDSLLPVVASHRDLGITVSSDLSSSLYVTDIARKAHQWTNMVIRCFVSQNIDLLMRAFITCV